MAEYILGNIHRSKVAGWFGPGSIIDFRSDNAPVSAMPAGLEEWDNAFPAPGCRNTQTINEPRLARKLGVHCFRIGPIPPFNEKEGEHKKSLVAVRFPTYLQCPTCDRIAPANVWGNEPGRTYRFCPECSGKSPGRRKIFTFPVRFITACKKGHIDEFPWEFWIRHRKDCTGKRSYTLKTEHPGLAGLILKCTACGNERSMDGIFSSKALEGYSCRGKKPWLAVPDEPCTETPRTLQRGASNLFFPIIESSLSIPPWSDSLQEAIGHYWDTIVRLEEEDRASFIEILSKKDLKPVLEEFKMDSSELSLRIKERLQIYNTESIPDIREEEYRQFTSTFSERAINHRDFEIRNTDIPTDQKSFFRRIVRVVRLREVQALKGFTRISPPSDENDPHICRLSISKLPWLPATEVRGEGIFLSFNPESLATWENSRELLDRAREIDLSFEMEWGQRYPNRQRERKITARFLLIHTFAHALMRQLTLECGYSGAALRERLYVSDGPNGMAGFLIYTASTDADGTLGGLQRQGEKDRIIPTILRTIHSIEWCSSDPLCMHGMNSMPEQMSKAACHACSLVPETSCEEFNRFLDRAMLIGTPENPNAGYFSGLTYRT